MIQARLFLYAAILLTRIGRFFRAPLTWWESRVEAKRAHELALVTLQLESQAGMVKAMADLMKGSLEGVAQASAAQHQLFATWLDGFKTTEVPVSTTVRESDEILAAREREYDYLKAHGLLDANPLPNPMTWHDSDEGRLSSLGIDVAHLASHLERH